MGGNSSKPKSQKHNKVPTQAEFAKIASNTCFSAEEVERLYPAYQRISNSIESGGGIDPHELQTALGISSAGISRRIFAAFERDGDGSLDFEEYVNGLSALCPRSSIEAKARFCFRVFDIDKGGTISRDELNEILALSFRENPSVHIPEGVIQKIISATFELIDGDGNGQITVNELIIAANKNPGILGCIDLDLDQLFGRN